jgi:hypothetical protein
MIQQPFPLLILLLPYTLFLFTPFIVTHFSAADSTTAATTTDNGTIIPIITLTAAIGYSPITYPFIAFYFAAAKVNTAAAADAYAIYISISIVANAKTATARLFFVILYAIS